VQNGLLGKKLTQRTTLMKNIFLDENYNRLNEGFWDNAMISAYSAETLIRIPGLSDWIDDLNTSTIANALNAAKNILALV